MTSLFCIHSFEPEWEDEKFDLEVLSYHYDYTKNPNPETYYVAFLRVNTVDDLLRFEQHIKDSAGRYYNGLIINYVGYDIFLTAYSDVIFDNPSRFESAKQEIVAHLLPYIGYLE